MDDVSLDEEFAGCLVYLVADEIGPTLRLGGGKRQLDAASHLSAT